MGAILSKRQRFSDAKIDFERLADLSPPDTRQRAKAFLPLGRVCARLNEHVQAKQHLDKAVQIDEKLGVFTADERSEIIGIAQYSRVQTAGEHLTSNTTGSSSLLIGSASQISAETKEALKSILL